MNGKKTVIGKTSRRFKELDLDLLHRCSMGHYATLQDWGFLLFILIPIQEGLNGMDVVPKNGDPGKTAKEGKKKENPNPAKLRSDP